MSMEHTHSAVCSSNSDNITHDNTSSSDNEVNWKSDMKRHTNLKKIMQTCNSAEEIDMPTSTIGDINFMKDEVMEYFAEALPLLERSTKEIKQLRKIENMVHINQENVKQSSYKVKKQQYEKSKSSLASLWKTLHTMSMLNKSREGNKYFHSDITPSFASFSVNVQPPTVTSAEVNHFLSTLNYEDKAILLREYEQSAKHNMEYVMESEENKTMCKSNKGRWEDHKHNIIKNERMEQCNVNNHSSGNKNMNVENVATETQIIDVDNVHKEREQCKEICTNKNDNDSNMSTEAVNNTEQMESEDSMSRYKKAWFTEFDDNKTSMNLDMNKDNKMLNSIYEKEDNKTNTEVKELHAVNSIAAIQENEITNSERNIKINECNAKHEEDNIGKESDNEEKNPLRVDHTESEVQEEVDEQKSEESETVSLEESFDQFSRRLLARDEWTKNLHSSEQNTQRNKVVNFFEHVNMTATPYSSESQKQSHVKWEQSEEQEYEPYELLEEDEFVIPPTEPFSSNQKSHVQQKENVQRSKSQNESDASHGESNRKESARPQNSLLLLSSHINTHVKVEQDELPEANKTLQNENELKGGKKMTKGEPLWETNKLQGWRSYLSNMVTRKDANKEREYCSNCDNSTKQKETNGNTSRQSVEWSRCTNSDATQVQHKTKAQNAYLRKRAYDILLANKVRKHDEQVYIAHLHNTMREQTQLLVHSMLPLIHELSHLVRQSCALLDVVAELDRAAFGACVVSPSQYLTSPRFRLRCAEITCQAVFSTTVTRITCRRCGEVYCPRCCTERGIGPDVTCTRPRLKHHTRNYTENNNNNNKNSSNKSGNANYHAFLLQASANDRHNVNEQEHRDNYNNSDATSVESKTQTNNNKLRYIHYTSTNGDRTSKMQETRGKEAEQQQQEEEEHISLGWEPICMRCWRVCAENVKRVAMERRRRSLVHQTHYSNNNYYHDKNVTSTSACANHQGKKVKVNDDDDDDNNDDNNKNKIDDNNKHHSTTTHVSDASSQAHSYHSSSTSQSTLPTSHHSISLEELSVKEAVLLGAYCDKELRLHDGFAPFYVMTDCNNDTVASWDVIAYKLARVGSAWRTHWQDAGKWAAVALHYTRLQAQMRIANLRTQVKWRELLQNFKQGALSTKKLLLKENRHLPRIVHRINKSAHAAQSSKETGSTKQRNRVACNDSKKKNNKDNVVDDNHNDDDDFIEDDYDEATLLNYFNRNLEDGTISDYTYSSHIMTS